MPIVVSTPPDNELACGPWATTADLCAPCLDDAVDPTLMQRCLKAATDVLFMLSARRYPGVCTDFVRPVASEPWPDPGRPIRAGWGQLGYGAAVGWASGYGAAAYAGLLGGTAPGVYEGGSFVAEQPLPGTPVVEVMEVKVDGVALDSSLWRVDDRRTLVHLQDPDGSRPGWPATQDRTLPDTEPGTWSVLYRYGEAPPPSGVLACAVLACEMAMALSPDAPGECRLPQRVQHIVRQGVDAVVLDPLAFIDKGRTGLPEVDMFLHAVNPNGLIRPATVWRPGTTARAHRTG